MLFWFLTFSAKLICLQTDSVDVTRPHAVLALAEIDFIWHVVKYAFLANFWKEKLNKDNLFVIS